MTTNDAAAIVRRFFEEGWNGGNADSVADLIHDNYASNDGTFFRNQPGPPGGLERQAGTEAFERHLSIYRQLYNGLHFTIERMILGGDTSVVTIWTATGTTRNHTFTNRGGQQVPYELRGQGISLSEIVDSKVRKHDMFWPRDALSP